MASSQLHSHMNIVWKLGLDARQLKSKVKAETG